MSRIHLLRCSSDTDPDHVGRLAGALRDLVAECSAPLWVLSDQPVRSRTREQFVAWTAPVLTGLKIAEDPDEAAGLLTLTRGSLHQRSGFEGAVHALAIGCASDDELAGIRDGLQPRVDRDLCGGCGMCVSLCGNGGILHNGHIAVVQADRCLACGDCLTECFPEALHFPDGGSRRLMERIASVAVRGADRWRGRMWFMLYLLPEPERRVTLSGSHVRQPALGLLCGHDPVALDQAALDLLESATGRSAQDETRCPENPLILLELAESAGAGVRHYSLQEHRADDLLLDR